MKKFLGHRETLAHEILCWRKGEDLKEDIEYDGIGS